MQELEKILLFATVVSIVAFVIKVKFTIDSFKTKNELVEMQFNSLSTVCTNIIIVSASMVLKEILKLFSRNSWIVSTKAMAILKFVIVISFIANIVVIIMALNKRTLRYCKFVSISTGITLVVSVVATAYCVFTMI